MMSFEQEGLLRGIEAHLGAALEDWHALYTALTQNIARADGNTIPAFLRQALGERGVAVQQLQDESTGSVLLFAQDSAAAQHSLLLYNSVAHPTPDPWEVIPLITQLVALVLYQKLCGGEPPTAWRWLLHPAGEDATMRQADMTRQHSALLRAAGCLCDATSALQDTGLPGAHLPLLALGAKGLLRVQLTVQTAPHPIPSTYGAIAPNAAWRLLWALSSLKNAQEEILLDGFYEMLKTPSDEVIALLRALPDTSQQVARQLGLEQLLYGLEGFQLHYVRYLAPTCTVSSFESQVSSTVQASPRIPSLSTAELTFHLVPDQDPETLYTLLQRHLDRHGFADVHMRKIAAHPPFALPLEVPFAQTVLQATSAACGQKPYLLPFTPESHPVHRLTHELQVPVVLTAMNTLGTTPTTAHDASLRQALATRLKQLLLVLAAHL